MKQQREKQYLNPLAIAVLSMLIFAGSSYILSHWSDVQATDQGGESKKPAHEAPKEHKPNWLAQWTVAPAINFFEAFFKGYGVEGGISYTLAIFALIVCIKLFLAPWSYWAYQVEQQKKLVQPYVNRIKTRNAENFQQAQLEEMLLYKRSGINLLYSFIGPIIQIGLFFVFLFYFVQHDPRLKDAGWGYAKDLSSPEKAINLGYKIPLLGEHISLMALGIALYTLVKTQLSQIKTKVSSPTVMRFMGYLSPVLLFVVFNNFPAGRALYFITVMLTEEVLKGVFKLFTNQEQLKKVILQRLSQSEGQKEGRSRTQMRLEKAMSRRKRSQS